MSIETIEWHGYRDGAIRSDDEKLAKVVRHEASGNLYVIDTDGTWYNVHPKVTACGWEDHGHERIEHAAGAYPVRWELHPYESDELRRAMMVDDGTDAGAESASLLVDPPTLRDKFRFVAAGDGSIEDHAYELISNLDIHIQVESEARFSVHEWTGDALRCHGCFSKLGDAFVAAINLGSQK